MYTLTSVNKRRVRDRDIRFLGHPVC